MEYNICSLKKYKGVDQFVKLAQKMPQYRFELVLNATFDEINHYVPCKLLVVVIKFCSNVTKYLIIVS